MHARRQIREASVTLATGLTTTGARVFDSRQFELEADDVPFWNVSTSDEPEDSQRSSMGPSGLLQRELTVLFVGVARELNGALLQQKLDLMAEELETAFTKSALAALLAGVRGLELVSTEHNFDIDETDQAIGSVELRWVITYFTADGAPSALI